MANYQTSGAGGAGRDSRAISEIRKHQTQQLQNLSKEHFSRSTSSYPQKQTRRFNDSRTYVSSIEPIHLKRPGYVVENSYQMKPTVQFPTVQIEKIAKDMLKNRLDGLEYDEFKCKQLSVDICDEIQRKIKSMHIPRYKYVCYVHIGQIMGQDMVIASRCLWDTEVDSFATANYKNNHLFATASVFGFYYE